MKRIWWQQPDDEPLRCDSRVLDADLPTHDEPPVATSSLWWAGDAALGDDSAPAHQRAVPLCRACRAAAQTLAWAAPPIARDDHTSPELRAAYDRHLADCEV